ncbi:hypothetical protein BC827DRAFT_1152346 [Russula dissimulans]|nr:hypothetical protein BC827DRAFT_1152346 [Russula dissimulans]
MGPKVGSGAGPMGSVVFEANPRVVSRVGAMTRVDFEASPRAASETLGGLISSAWEKYVGPRIARISSHDGCPWAGMTGGDGPGQQGPGLVYNDIGADIADKEAGGRFLTHMKRDERHGKRCCETRKTSGNDNIERNKANLGETRTMPQLEHPPPVTTVASDGQGTERSDQLNQTQLIMLNGIGIAKPSGTRRRNLARPTW